MESVRIDKWLWAVRICKTRTLAGILCRRGKVKVDGQRVKPSRMITVGNKISVSKQGLEWEYEVLKCIDKRVGAKIAQECRYDINAEENMEKLSMIRKVWVPWRAKGEGRPTKKDRRKMDELKND